MIELSNGISFLLFERSIFEWPSQAYVLRANKKIDRQARRHRFFNILGYVGWATYYSRVWLEGCVRLIWGSISYFKIINLWQTKRGREGVGPRQMKHLQRLCAKKLFRFQYASLEFPVVSDT